MVAELGFEPRQTESESAVLPLHNSAILNCYACDAYIVYNEFCNLSICFLEKIKEFLYKLWKIYTEKQKSYYILYNNQ